MYYSDHYPKLIEIAEAHFGLDDLFKKTRQRKYVRARVTVALILRSNWFQMTTTEGEELGLMSFRSVEWLDRWEFQIRQNRKWLWDLKNIKTMYRSHIEANWVVKRQHEEKVIVDNDAIIMRG